MTWADAGFLLATKLVAQRAKDADDVIALARRIGLSEASPGELEAHIRQYYTDLDGLELVLGATDVDGELSLLAQDASRLLLRTARAARPLGREVT